MIVNENPVTLPAAAAFDPYLRVKLTAGVIALASGSEDEVGTLAQRVIATDLYATVIPRSKSCVRLMVAAAAFDQFAVLYAAANGTVDDSGTLLRGLALEAAAGAGSIVRVLTDLSSLTGNVARDNFTQDDLQKYVVPDTDLRVWDAFATLPVTTAGNDDLGLILGTFLTSAPKLQSADAKATTKTQKIGFQFTVPPEYVAGETINLRINAGMNTTISDGTATVDAQVVRRAAPTTDICSTAAQSINSLTAADKDFVLTPTNVVPGDVLIGVITVAITDGATATAVIGEINKITVLADIKG